MNEIIELDLDIIRPDPGQPRCLLPSDLAHALAGGAPPAQVIETFEKGDDTGKLAALWELANSILSEGLIQPITVRPAGAGGYVIVAGERRYWAHWLLVRKYGPRYGRIRCVVQAVQGSLRAVQLIENIQRADLGAVEIAVSLAMLIREIEMEPQPESDTAVSLFAQARAVAGRRLARGTWAEVTCRVGRTRSHWNHYLDLLKLPDAVLELARAHNLTEYALRPVVAEPDPARQVAMVKTLITKKDTERETAADADASPPSHRPGPGQGAQAARLIRRLQATLSGLSQDDRAALATALDGQRALLDGLTEWLQMLSHSLGEVE